MRRILFSFIVLGWLVVNPGSTGSAETPAAPVVYRYLIVIDTSFSMARKEAATIKIVRDLIMSGFENRVLPGDTIGIWTFNESVVTDRFPALKWGDQSPYVLAGMAAKNLGRQRYQKSTRLDRAMGEVAKAMAAAPTLTILIVTDGDDRMAGTPFDRGINAIFANYAKILNKERRPFVTVLTAHNGVFTNWNVQTGSGGSLLPDPTGPPPRPFISERFITNVIVKAPAPQPASSNRAVSVIDNTATPPPPATTRSQAAPIKVVPEPLGDSAKNQAPANPGTETRRSDGKDASLPPKSPPATDNRPMAKGSQTVPPGGDPPNHSRTVEGALPSDASRKDQRTEDLPQSKIPAPAQLGLIDPPPGTFKRNPLLMASGIVVLVGVGLLLAVVLRSGRRRPGRSSLISQSIETDGK